MTVVPEFRPDDPVRQNSLLLRVIEATSSGPGVETLAAAVAALITEATATDVCFVHVLDDAEGSLTLAGATPPFDQQVGIVRLPMGVGVTGWVARHRRPAVIVEHKEADPRYLPVPALRGTDFTSMASVPMATGPAGLVGVLNVHTVQRREFSDHDVRLLVGIGGLVAGALHQARTHRRLAIRERAHERFIEQAIAAQEAERRRLASDIHDGISQRLATLSFHLDALGNALHGDPGQATEQLRLSRELVRLTLDEARAAIGGLRPPVLDDLGLAGGLTTLARSTPGIAVHLDLADARLAEHVEVALYRIAQECLQNVQRHSGAHTVRLRFTVQRGRARLTVTDDGRGFPCGPDGPAAPGYGIRSMTERAELVGGTVEVRSGPGLGTTVTATIPIGADDAGEVARHRYRLRV